MREGTQAETTATTPQTKPYPPNHRPSLNYPSIHEDEKEDGQAPRAEPQKQPLVTTVGVVLVVGVMIFLAWLRW